MILANRANKQVVITEDQVDSFKAGGWTVIDTEAPEKSGAEVLEMPEEDLEAELDELEEILPEVKSAGARRGPAKK